MEKIRMTLKVMLTNKPESVLEALSKHYNRRPSLFILLLLSLLYERIKWTKRKGKKNT